MLNVYIIAGSGKPMFLSAYHGFKAEKAKELLVRENHVTLGVRGHYRLQGVSHQFFKEQASQRPFYAAVPALTRHSSRFL